MGSRAPLQAACLEQVYVPCLDVFPVSETPRQHPPNWYFVNLSGDAHPMHLHLVQFQIVSRQDFNADKYLADWLKLNQGGLMDGMLPFKWTGRRRCCRSDRT